MRHACVTSLYELYLKQQELSLFFFQFDYGGWMPNTPTSMQRPPPTAKGKTSEATMLQTLPDVNTTVRGMAALWLLSKDSSDFVSGNECPSLSVCHCVAVI